MGVFSSTVMAVKVTLSIVISVLLFTSDASAHHSMTLFDGTTLATVEGRVTRVAWRSPHVYIFVESREPDGESAEWRFEALPVPIMIRHGWMEDSLSVGDLVTAQGYPARGSGQKYAWVRRIIKEDGTILDPGQIPGSPGTREGDVVN